MCRWVSVACIRMVHKCEDGVQGHKYMCKCELHGPGLPCRSFPGLRAIPSILSFTASSLCWTSICLTSGLSFACHRVPLFLDSCWRHACHPPASLTPLPAYALTFSTPLPAPLPFAPPAASGQASAGSHSLIMVPRARGLLLCCFLLQLQGPLGAVGMEVLSVRGGLLCGLGEWRSQAVCSSGWDINRHPLTGGSI